MSPVAAPVTPPEEAPWTIDELIRKRSFENPNTPLVAYPANGIDYEEFTARQLDTYAFRIAQSYSKCMSRRKSSEEQTKVVGLLAPSNIDYLLSTIALSKMGMTVLFLSTRLSQEAYFSLLNQTGCVDLLIDESMRKVASSLQAAHPGLNVHNLANASIYSYPLGKETENTAMDADYTLALENLNHCWIIHSSGSTGLPKPIYQTHAAALRNYANNFDMYGFITLPLYHAHGISSVFRGIHSRKLIHMYNASLPLTAPTLISTMKQHKFEIFYGVPYALKLLGESVEGLKLLSSMKLVMFGGSSCPKDLGDQLVRNGVKLISHYGTTETGQLMTSFRDADDQDWDYLRVTKGLEPFIRWERTGPGVFELVVLDGWPSKVATNRPDGAYATKDLFEQHPSKPNCFRWTGRLDDTLVLLNGEKANPIPIEHALRQNPLVAEAVVFGSSKPQLGAFIIPVHGQEYLTKTAFMSRLASSLESANSSSPAYSQLATEMIRVLPAGTLYPKTDKDTVIRARFYRQFAEDIEKVYNEAQSDSEVGTRTMPFDELSQSISTLVCESLRLRDHSLLTSNTDFFAIGMDSLQALRIRAKIVKTIKTDGRMVGQNVVFEHPTVAALAKHLDALQHGTDAKTATPEEQMQELLEKYSTFRPHIPGDSVDPPAVLITGVTGSLGAHVAAQYVQDPNVDKVFCLVRAKSPRDANARVVSSMIQRRVYHTLTSKERAKIVAFPSKLDSEDLGVDVLSMQQMLRQVTVVIHLAWAVNFNMGVGSFESHIAGVRNLIQFCLDSKRQQPAAFNFGSSVSAVAATPGAVEEETEVDFTRAQGMGYAQSKLVAENICARAAQTTTVTARVQRIGQIIGDTKHGIWNSTEAIPLMIQSAITVGVLPELDESPTWLPVDVVAKSIIELASASPQRAARDAVFHIVNPTSFHWTRQLLPALETAGLRFDRVSQREWVQRLRNSSPDAVRNPPFKLLDFFASKYDREGKRSQSYYRTDSACSLSPTLHSAPNLSDAHVNSMVRHWKSNCWQLDDTQRSTILIIAGPCGAGKSTIAQAVSEQRSLPWIEADTLHSAEAVAKMSRGEPLNDEDRSFWLQKIKRKFIAAAVDTKGVVVSCSALKADYRDVLRDTPSDVRVLFWMLEASRTRLVERVDGRREHYMPSSMVDSQVESLEQPRGDESDIVPFDASGSKEDVVGAALTLAGYLL